MWNEEESKWEKTTDTQIKSPFFELLEKINQINGIDRIRFTSSNPHDMTQDILESHFILDKTCNYLHFALQS
jgi:tRNA-2-methylthio-N6-dimethylallyladenosine synthase